MTVTWEGTGRPCHRLPRPCGEQPAVCSYSSSLAEPSSDPFLRSPRGRDDARAKLYGRPERGVSLLKSGSQTYPHSGPQGSPRLFLLLWAGFVSQRGRRCPDCSSAVNVLPWEPGDLALVSCPPWERLLLEPAKTPPATRPASPQETLSSASSHCLAAFSHS